MEALAVALGFGPEGGTKNVRFRTVDSVSPLHDALRLARGVPAVRDGYFLRAARFFSVASYRDEVGYLGGYGGSLHARSHGARPRGAAARARRLVATTATVVLIAVSVLVVALRPGAPATFGAATPAGTRGADPCTMPP